MTSHLKGTLLKSQERPVQNLENDLIYKFVHLQILNDCSDNIYAIKILFALNFPFWFTLPKKRRKGLAHDYNIFATDTDCQTQNGSMLGVYFLFHFCWCFQLWVPSKRNGSVTQFCCFVNCGMQSKHEGVRLSRNIQFMIQQQIPYMLTLHSTVNETAKQSDMSIKPLARFSIVWSPYGNGKHLVEAFTNCCYTYLSVLHITDVCFHKIAVISSTVNHQVNEVDKFTLVYWPMLSEKKRKKGSTGFWCGGFLGWSWNYTVGPFSGFLWHVLATFISQYFLLTSTVVGSYIYRYTYIAHASSCHSHWSVNCYYLQLSMTVWVWGIVQVVKSKSLNKNRKKITTFWSGPSSPWRFFIYF